MPLGEMRGRAFGRARAGLTARPESSLLRRRRTASPAAAPASLWPCGHEGRGRAACPRRAERERRSRDVWPDAWPGVGHERVAPGLVLRHAHAVADEESHRFQFIRQRTIRLGVAHQIADLRQDRVASTGELLVVPRGQRRQVDELRRHRGGAASCWRAALDSGMTKCGIRSLQSRESRR